MYAAENAVHMLLVEDDDIDAQHFVRSFRQANLPNPISVAKDGIEALQVLRGEGGYVRLPRPYVVLLDINMPRMNGLEFLRELRADSDLRRSIVFVFTTSDRMGDIRAAYEAHVAGYFLKQTDSETDRTLVEMLRQYRRLAAFPGVE